MITRTNKLKICIQCNRPIFKQIHNGGYLQLVKFCLYDGIHEELEQ